MRYILITSLLFCVSLFSTEIDSFTLRDPGMRDSLQELNQIVQGYFTEALQEANQAQSCDPEIFETAFQNVMPGILWSRIENDIENSETMDHRVIGRKNSIYQDVNLFEGIALHMARLGFLMKTGDFYVGSDKLGHFFDTGHTYYQKSSFKEALDYGEMTERTYYGLQMTAVYSYADLAANLDGYTFWNRLAKGKNAYVTCSNNIWRQQYNFNWADYINAAWDEGINCNRYRNDHVTRSVHNRIAALGMSCPVNTGYCSDMISRYGSLAQRIVAKECFEEKALFTDTGL